MFVTLTYKLKSLLGAGQIGRTGRQIFRLAGRSFGRPGSWPTLGVPRVAVVVVAMGLALPAMLTGVMTESFAGDKAGGETGLKLNDGAGAEVAHGEVAHDEVAHDEVPDEELVEAEKDSDGGAEKINPLKAALQAYREKRVNDAVTGFEEAAQNDSVIARFLLAHIYRTGKAGAVDHRRAYLYYRKITDDFAENGNHYARLAPFVAHAYVQLARYMEVGIEELDMPADPMMARALYERAAHFGDVEGQYQLGRFLIETGQARNVKLGQRWLTRAAMKNNPKAQAYLGALYWQGDLIQRKQGLALAWIEFARRNATGSVKSQVERLYQAVRFDMTEAQETRAELFIGRLRNKYNVIWREVPANDKADDALLDGIILADPPQGLDLEQLEARAPRNQVQDFPAAEGDAQNEGGEGYFGNRASSFGFQMFGYGGKADR